MPQALGRQLTLPIPVTGGVEPQPKPVQTPPSSPAPATVTRAIDESAADKAYGEGCDLFWSNRFPEALAAFNKAINFSDGDARFCYFKGLAEMALGDAKAGEASIPQGAQLEHEKKPDSREIGFALVRVQGSTRRYLEGFRNRIRAAAPPSVSQPSFLRSTHTFHQLTVKNRPEITSRLDPSKCIGFAPEGWLKSFPCHAFDPEVRRLFSSYS